jgi:hypothetical protein
MNCHQTLPHGPVGTMSWFRWRRGYEQSGQAYAVLEDFLTALGIELRGVRLALGGQTTRTAK